MGSLYEKSSLVDNSSATIEEMEEEEEGAEDGAGCACFRCFGVGRRRRNNERVSLLQQGKGSENGLPASRESLWRRKLKDLKEISELLCGPKWKNFIRKLGVYFNGDKRRRSRAGQFQYDPQSYALNFDEGDADDDEDLDGSRLGFSSRFAPPPKISSG